MTTKLKFLGVLLAMLVGGVNGTWAVDSKTFTGSNNPTVGSSETIGNITVVYGNTTSVYTGETFQYNNTDYYGLKAHKTESSDLDSNNIPLSNSDNFFLQLTTFYPGTMQVGFYNSDKNSRGLRCYKKSSSGEVSVINNAYTVNALTMGTLTFDMEPGYTYYVYDTNTGNIYYTGFTFTPEVRSNSVEYSHTWVFNRGGDAFSNTVGAMLTANSKWTLTNEKYYYNGITNTSGGDALYDGNGNLIEETRGLKFNATTPTDINTDLRYDIQLAHGASVIVPNAKIGQKIVLYGWWPSGGTVTATNAEISSGVSSFTGAGSGAEYTFIVSANGDVTFTVGSGAYYGIWSIAVVKNELTTFEFSNIESYYGESGDSPSGNNQVTGEYIGRTTTFKYKIGRSQVLRTRVNVAPGFDVTSITANNTNFGVSSNTSTVLDPSSYSVNNPSNSKIWYWGVQVKKPGTADLTYRFNGTDAYNAKDYTERFIIEKDDPTIEFISSFLIKKVGDANFTRNITLNGLTLPVTDDNAGTVNVTYSSDNTSVATVSATTGEVTIGSTPGIAYITATLAATDYNNKVEKKYKLIVNPTSGTDPTLTWVDGVTSTSVAYNNDVTHIASVNNSDQTVLYSSENPSIASVDASGKVTGTGVGTTKIYAIVDPTSTYNAVQIEYTITVTSAGDLTSLRFVPNEGKVNNGKSITPKLAFPTIPNDGVTSLKVTQIQVLERNGIAVSESALTTDAAIEACDIISIDDADNLKNNWILNVDGKVNKVNVTINGKAIGKAEITVTFTSTYYNTATAKYTIEVTDALTTNFSWADGNGSPEYYTYAGDYMMLPAISGNSNGNNNYSNGAKNSSSYTENGTSHSALQKYKYEIKNGSVKWNSKDIKIGEGFPDFEIVTDGISSPGAAAVFFGRGEGSSHPDTLMIYCETAGDVKLRAYDPQNHSKYCDATIHILPISNIEGTTGSATTVTNGMAYPYTWDFTTNFNMASMVGATDQYWIPIKDNNGNATGEYTNGYGFFNLDWADVDTDNATNDRIYKYFIAGASSSATGYMHQFNGMMLQMKGSTSWANKMDRMRIKNYDATSKSGRLQFIGGYHTMKLFLPEAAKRPSSFKIFVKASGTGRVCIMGTDEKEVSSTVKNLTNTATVHSFDISDVSYTSEGYILLGFDDATVDWIAMSTEAKSIAQNTGTTYAASTYSYNEDLDFNYTDEIYSTNGFVPYYASTFTGGNVVLSRLTDNNSAPAMSGLVLKGPSGSTGNSYSYYMIAKARNTNNSDYGAPSLSGNLLLPTIANKPIYRFETIGGTTYTNFVLASHYYKVIDNEEDESQIDPSHISGSDTNAEWSFVRVDGTFGDENPDSDVEYNANIPSNRAYLHLPNRQGNVDTGYEGASSRGVFGIIFEDDPEATNIHTINGLRMADNDAWYTLQGMKVTTPVTNGIYIHKGKKVVVK